MGESVPGLGDGAEVWAASWRDGLRLPPSLTVSEWADQFRVLSKVASAEAGRWRTSRTPYLREIMDCLSPSSPVRKVVLRKGAQVGATELGNNWVAYQVATAGGAMLIVQPTVEMAKRWSRQRLAPMLRDTPALAGRVKDARSRDSGNTMLAKEYEGGILVITGANSAVGLRSMPAALVFADEVDAYPETVDDEGHPVELAERRAATFPFRKVFEPSTPRVKHASRIDADFEASDQAFYYVPCPHCGTKQRLEADRLVYDPDAPDLCDSMACIECGALMPEGRKPQMLEAGEWHRLDRDSGAWVRREPDPRKAAGFHLDALYSPLGWTSWAEIAVEREAAKSDENRARTYQNLMLGLPYEERSDAPDWQRLYEQRETYPIGVVPAGAYVLTLGVDVQRRRIELTWWGWGPGFEGWWVDHEVIDGDTSRDEVWQSLTEAARRRLAHAEGAAELPADLVCIDMQYETDQVKRWVESMRSRRVIAVQGSDAWGSPTVIGWGETGKDGRRKGVARRGFRFLRVAVSSAKLELYRRLRREPQEEPPPWGGPWVHLPQVSQEVVEQLTAETVRRRKTPSKRAGASLEWVKTRERNEQLDLAVYAMAGAYRLKVDQFTATSWERLRARWHVEQPPALATPEPRTETEPRPTRAAVRARQRRPRRNWVKDF